MRRPPARESMSHPIVRSSRSVRTGLSSKETVLRRIARASRALQSGWASSTRWIFELVECAARAVGGAGRFDQVVAGLLTGSDVNEPALSELASFTGGGGSAAQDGVGIVHGDSTGIGALPSPCAKGLATASARRIGYPA